MLKEKLLEDMKVSMRDKNIIRKNEQLPPCEKTRKAVFCFVENFFYCFGVKPLIFLFRSGILILPNKTE